MNVGISKSANAQKMGTHPLQCGGNNQYGLTLVELLVAMVISLLIALAAISALTVTRQGFTTVDASSQLRDNLRFATDLVQRVGVQTGYRDAQFAGQLKTDGSATGLATDPDPNISGFNNALISASDPLNLSVARTAGVDGFGSDVLILRYQAVETFSNSGVSDGSMIDCMGNSLTLVPANKYDRVASVFHVAVSQGEPSLMCTTISNAGVISTQPIVKGVENFQVLYGVRGVNVGFAPANAASSTQPEYAPDSYLRADQMTVIGNPAGTRANWRNVRDIRIGLVVRGPLNSTQDKVVQTHYPFGVAKASGTGTKGSAFSNTAALDPGTVFTTTADGRLRQSASFTIHLRNAQGL
jgi:type IV pilus assembly protein PilW